MIDCCAHLDVDGILMAWRHMMRYTGNEEHLSIRYPIGPQITRLKIDVA